MISGMIAGLAHRAWVALNRRRERQFRSALRDPERTQGELLKAYLRRNADTLAGRRYGFERIDSLASYRERVPVRSYDEMADDVERIRKGRQGVLTRDPVVRLVPSSGSTAARKLIPFTRRSQDEFRRAVGPWIVDLQRRRPRALSGRAYWAVSPKAVSAEPGSEEPDGAVPIGFDDDAAYLGGLAAHLVDRVLAVPSSVRHIEDLDAYRRTTLAHLLAARDLGLVSVWHPSFFTLLLDALPEHWQSLLDELPPTRARELRDLSPHELDRIWPRLDVVSCWRDGQAAAPARELERRLGPAVTVEAKGLLATECVVTTPYAGTHPLAMRSHVFEFLDDDGTVHGVGDLRQDADYAVVVTTGGGLYRYRLGDRVRVKGFLESTPCLEFLGRDDRVSDLRGEKLSEGFVAGVLGELLADSREQIRFAMLAPQDEPGAAPHYRLFLECDSSPPLDLSRSLDDLLRANPHYELARDLGQLDPADIIQVDRGAHARYLEARRAAGQRLGDIKPPALEVESGWTDVMATGSRLPFNSTTQDP